MIFLVIITLFIMHYLIFKTDEPLTLLLLPEYIMLWFIFILYIVGGNQ